MNGGSGFLYNRLRYLRKKEKNQLKKKAQPSEEPENIVPNVEDETVAENAASTDDGDVTNDPYQMDDLLYLKTVVVHKNNLLEIQDILRKTFDRRRQWLCTDKVNLLENFPCMFVDPKLVSKFVFNFNDNYHQSRNCRLVVTIQLHFKICSAFDSFHFFHFK